MTKFCAVPKKIGKKGKEDVACDQTRSQLLPILQKIQSEKGYISDTDMQNVAAELGIHPVEVYSVATFYSFFNLKKKGKHIIRISDCISCVLAGNEKVIKAFEKTLGIKVGETTKNKKFTLELTSCIGMCDQAPSVMVDGKLIGNVTAKKVKEIIKSLK